jgi:adenosine deaminase
MIDPITLPKAELHLHIEGTLEPELMLELATRNRISVPYADVESVMAAYVFGDLESFLDIYYQACSVLIEESDFYDLTMAYLRRAIAQGVRHAEIFFDPQTHTMRGIDLGTVILGISRALADGRGGTAGLHLAGARPPGSRGIDHGVRCLEDPHLVERLVADQIPLTVCPLSNVKLRVFDELGQHPLARMLEHGLCATVSSDDPAYFGGYVAENFSAVRSALGLADDVLLKLARNSFAASFLDDAAKARYLAEIDAYTSALRGRSS